MTPTPPGLIEAARRSSAAVHECMPSSRACHVCELRRAVSAIPPDAVVVSKGLLMKAAAELSRVGGCTVNGPAIDGIIARLRDAADDKGKAS